MLINVPPPRPHSLFDLAVDALKAAGHRVEPSPGMEPDLYRIDNGPELTATKVIYIAAQKGLLEDSDQ